jgi:hypothetical protein
MHGPAEKAPASLGDEMDWSGESAVRQVSCDSVAQFTFGGRDSDDHDATRLEEWKERIIHALIRPQNESRPAPFRQRGLALRSPVFEVYDL